MPRPVTPMPRPAPTVRQPHPTRPVIRNPQPAPAQPRTTDTDSSRTSSTSSPFTLIYPRRPVYTPTTTTKEFMAGQRALLSSKTYPVYTGQGFTGWGGYGWSAYSWGGFGWSPLFFGAYFCDPISMMMQYGYPVCFFPPAYLYGYYPMFGYDPFLANFAGFGLFSSPNLLFGSGFLGPNCSLCSSPAFDPFTLGLYGALPFDPYVPTPSSSVSISDGDLPGLVPTNAAPESSSTTGDGSSAYTYVNPSSTGTPITLVLTNGTKIEATQYQLTGNGMFEYVTTGGRMGKIPFTQVDVKATMEANPDKGEDFLVPQSQPSQPQNQSRQPQAPTSSTE
jgi:hypothetical protein